MVFALCLDDHISDNPSVSNWKGDGVCDGALDCEKYDWDGGDCKTQSPTQVPAEAGPCVHYSCQNEEVCVDHFYEQGFLGDEYCDVSLNCPRNGFDKGDCFSRIDLGCNYVACSLPVCVDDFIVAGKVGDGTCNAGLFDCEVFDYDNGDCERPVTNSPSVTSTFIEEDDDDENLGNQDGQTMGAAGAGGMHMVGRLWGFIVAGLLIAGGLF